MTELRRLPPPQSTTRLASLADFFPVLCRFLPFPPTTEPGPRLMLGTVHFLLGRGGWWNFLNPHYELPWPPHSVLIFSHGTPQRRSFFGGDPPSFEKRHHRN